jgi:hypothetical protein
MRQSGQYFQILSLEVTLYASLFHHGVRRMSREISPIHSEGSIGNRGYAKSRDRPYLGVDIRARRLSGFHDLPVEALPH